MTDASTVQIRDGGNGERKEAVHSVSMEGGLPSVQIDPETTRIYEPVTLTAKFPVDPELVVRCQQAGDRPHRGTRVGKMLELYPYDVLKRLATAQAKTFLRHMRNQGYEPLQAETELELWGPFRERLDTSKAADLKNFEEGNHLIPQGHWGSAAHGVWRHDLVRGPRQLDVTTLGHRDWRFGVVFMLRGKFLATGGHREETTGTLLV